MKKKLFRRKKEIMSVTTVVYAFEDELNETLDAFSQDYTIKCDRSRVDHYGVVNGKDMYKITLELETKKN